MSISNSLDNIIGKLPEIQDAKTGQTIEDKLDYISKQIDSMHYAPVFSFDAVDINSNGAPGIVFCGARYIDLDHSIFNVGDTFTLTVGDVTQDAKLVLLSETEISHTYTIGLQSPSDVSGLANYSVGVQIILIEDGTVDDGGNPPPANTSINFVLYAGEKGTYPVTLRKNRWGY